MFRDLPAPGLHFRASGQTGGQGHSGQGQGRGYHHVPRCPSCCPFDANRGGKRGILWSSEEIPMRAARGTEESCVVLLRLHTHCHNKDNCLKGAWSGIRDKGIPYFIVRFHTLSVIIPTHDYEFLFSMRELDSPLGLLEAV